MVSNPKANFISSKNKWCSDFNRSYIDKEYVELNFMEPVLVVMLMSGGIDSSYVTNFSIYYMLPPNDKSYRPYGVTKEPVQVSSWYSIFYTKVL